VGLVLVTGPSEEPVSLGEVKPFLRVEMSDTNSDSLIYTLITAARQHLDGRDGWLGRALVTQEWDLFLDGFPSPSWNPWNDYADAIRVPLPPLQSVTFIKYVDNDGVEQTWTSSEYRVDKRSQPGRITPEHGKSYPSTRAVMNAVTVRFKAGYGQAAAVPGPIKLGITALVAHFYEHREPVITGTIAEELPMHVQALLAPYQVWSVV
jgi:uncharacterized phiE125 gp8 family phage protein